MEIKSTFVTQMPGPQTHDRSSTLSMAKLTIAIAFLAGLSWAAFAFANRLQGDKPPSHLTHRVERGDLWITVDEQGTLESAENLEIKSRVRGYNAVLWIIESGTIVNKGDEIVRLDSLFIQEQVDERTKYANWSQSAADGSAAAVARARIAVEEYDQGRFQSEMLSMEKDVTVAKATLENSKDRVRHVRVMAQSGYISELEVEEKQFAVKQAQLNLALKQTQLDVLKNFTYKEQLQDLKGQLASIEASHKANVERAMADTSRRDRAIEELQYCVIKAPRSGLVIHPNAAKWESGPIAEGTNVHKDQVLLLMPDLDQMQVKVGVHELLVKRVKPEQTAVVSLPTKTLKGKVTDVASITKPAGWWTGNQVRYDTIVTLPKNNDLRPGTSAEVEIEVARYHDVLRVPVAAIVERDDKAFCWVHTADGPARREITIGDSNDIFTIVHNGITEGDQVLLNPFAYEAPVIEESQNNVEAEVDTKPKAKSKLNRKSSESVTKPPKATKEVSKP